MTSELTYCSLLDEIIPLKRFTIYLTCDIFNVYFVYIYCFYGTSI